MSIIPKEHLVVDDNRVLIDENAYGIVTYALTSAAAIRELEDHHPFYAVWLDHDLGGDDTTMPVVDWLVQHNGRGPEYIVVHTQNPVGRQKIVLALERYYEVKSLRNLPLEMRRRDATD